MGKPDPLARNLDHVRPNCTVKVAQREARNDHLQKRKSRA